MKNENAELVLGKKKKVNTLLTELFQHRELLYLFALRDLKLKYRQTILGFAWVVLQPLLMMAIFSSVFAQRIETGTQSIPYPILVFSGLIIYTMFSNGVSGASNTLVSHAHIIKKTYFPRIILPASSVLSSSVDFLASLPVLVILMAFIGPEVELLRLLAFALMAFFLALLPTLGFGILFSALNVRYRDISFVIPFFLMIMLFVSPIIYPVGIQSNEFFQWVLTINPLSGPIELLKSGIDPTYTANLAVIGYGSAISLLFLLTGLVVFTRVQKNIADII